MILRHYSFILLQKRVYSKANRPLNVIFFGSDQYSAHSLIALSNLLRSKYINSLQVVTRSPKPSGRYLSHIREVPIVSVNDELKLPPVIRCDSKKDLQGLASNPEMNFNMLIAVSFGKLIPENLIEKVGGNAFNIHPSLLPKYRGSSPIQYTLLNRDKYTGVTIQTLHPKKFDHGEIIKQTEPLEVEQLLKLGSVSNFEEDVPEKVAILMDQLGLKSGSLLMEMIKTGSFEAMKTPEWEASNAPKITTDMKRIQWENESKVEILAKNDALGQLFAFKSALPKRKKDVVEKRIIFPKLFSVSDNVIRSPGEFSFDEDNNMLIIQCQDGEVGTTSIQFEGFAVETIDVFLKRLAKRCGKACSTKFT